MSALSGLLQVPIKTTGWIDDRMNPIVVKELRQAVKSRFVVSVLGLMLTLLMIILGVTLLEDTGRGFDESAGADLFLVFQSILLATCLFFVPIYVGVRLAAERSGVASDLIYVTTIRPSSIVWGKLLAGMVVMALVFSACAPFMVITYLLRGIDLPTILFILGLDVLIVLAATQLAIFVGTMPIGWPVKAFLGLVLAFFSLMTLIGLTEFIEWELLRSGIGSAMDDPDFWIGMGATIGGWLAGLGLIFVLSIAMITAPTANRALMPRLYFTFLWAGSFVLFLALMFQFDEHEVIYIWLVLISMLLLAAAVISVSERETFGPRLRRGIPRLIPLRIPTFFFYSGAAGGLLWIQMLMGLTLLAVYLTQQYSLDHFGYYNDDFFEEQWLQRLASTALWFIGYLLLAVFICRRLTWIRIKNAPAVTGLVGLMLMAVASTVPITVAYALDPNRWDRNPEFWLLINPFGPLFCEDRDWRGGYGEIALPLSIIFFVLMQAVNLPWYLKQVFGFAPLPKEKKATASVIAPAVDTHVQAVTAPASQGENTDG